MNAKITAEKILKAVGGKSNIREMYHCVTRLRFYLKDAGKANPEEIKKIDGVLGAQYKTDQLQVIIGNQVETVYDEMIKLTGFIHDEKSSQQKKKFQLGGIFETMAAILLPVVPILAGTGMIKGLIIILTSYCGVDAASDTMQVLTIASDCVFYFFPFLVAWSASNRFNTKTAVAMALAGCLLYPTMTAGLASGANPLHFFGLPIPFVKYASSSIPIILSVWVLSYVYPLVDKRIPKSLRLVFTPMFVMLIMCPLTLIGIAPLANYISKGLAAIVRFLFDTSPILAGAIIGSTRPLVVLTGMHMSLGAICVENLSTYGYDVLLPINTMGTLAIVGATLGTWYKSKKTETKSVAFSAFISAFIGITEPGIYGVLLKFKNALIAAMIGGGIAGAFVAFFKGTASAFVNSCILSLPVFAGPGLVYVCIGMAMSSAIAFIVVQVLGLSEEKSDLEPDPAVEPIKPRLTVYSPMEGDIVPLQELNDPAFSDGAIGKGVAIKPSKGTVTAPFDGKITMIYPTKHAIGITSKDGVECIIHIGIDTVNLKGKYFDVKVKQDQDIKTGDVLAEVDLSNILKEGYSTVTPVIVTNSNQYLDVLPNEMSGLIVSREPLLSILV